MPRVSRPAPTTPRPSSADFAFPIKASCSMTVSSTPRCASHNRWLNCPCDPADSPPNRSFHSAGAWYHAIRGFPRYTARRCHLQRAERAASWRRAAQCSQDAAVFRKCNSAATARIGRNESVHLGINGPEFLLIHGRGSALTTLSSPSTGWNPRNSMLLRGPMKHERLPEFTWAGVVVVVHNCSKGSWLRVGLHIRRWLESLSYPSECSHRISRDDLTVGLIRLLAKISTKSGDERC